MPTGQTISEIADYAAKNILNLSKPIKPDELVVGWVNDAIRQLKKDACVYADAEITAEDDTTWYDLPNDYIRLHRVTDQCGRRLRSSVFELDPSGQIRFGMAGTYTLHYNRRSAPSTMLSDMPDCHPMIQDALPFYLAYRYDNLVFPADSSTMARYQEYIGRVAESVKEINWRPRIIKIH
jgi:hypothetical protein